MTHRRLGFVGLEAGRSQRRGQRVAFALILGMALLPSMARTSLGFLHGLPLWLALLALVNSRRAFAVLTLPLALCLPAVLYYQYVYRMAPGVSLWLIVLDSSLVETVEYLRGFALPLSIGCVAVLAGFGTAWPRLHGPVFHGPRLRLLCLASVSIPIAMMFLDGRDPTVVARAGRYFRDSFPWSVLAGRVQASREISAFSDIERDVGASVALQVRRVAAADEPRTIILVIGESARRDRHAIYGYAQETTPLAERLDGLLAFSDAVTLYPQTVDSVPVIVAKRDKEVPSIPLPSVLRVFSAAGYRTTWISNQAALGSDDSPVSVYAKQADGHWFARALSRYGPIPLDEVLLPRLQEQLEGLPVDRFIVLHLFGSHEEFKRRYPAEYGLLSDAYDNSIRYTDALLGQVVEMLASIPGQNALLYVADHGLKLGECDGRSEHYDAKGSYEVPLYLWTSAAWRRAHAEQWQRAAANVNEPTTTMSVFDTLVDLADLRYPEYRDDLSLLSTALSHGPRIVHTYAGPVDYDRASNDVRCHLVLGD